MSQLDQESYGTLRGRVGTEPDPLTIYMGAPSIMAQPPKAANFKYAEGDSSSPGGRQHLGAWQDVWAGVLFLVHIAAVVVVAVVLGVKGINVEDLKDSIILAPAPAGSASSRTPASATSPGSSPMDIHFNFDHYAPQLAGAAVVGSLFAWLWLQLIKLAPRVMITVSLWWGVVVRFAVAGVCFAPDNGSTFVGLVFTFFGVLNIIYALRVRPRIPFAASMLKQVVKVARRYNGTVWVSYLALLTLISWMGVWTLGAAGAMSQSQSGLFVFLLLLSLFWTSEVIRNCVHVTAAGTVATYYFQRLAMPPGPTARALRRALTTSFGSICFGSLLVAIIQALRGVLRAARNSGEGNEILICCANFLLFCVERLLQYFNKWAYIQIAIYGKGYMRAAKDTWDLFHAQGLELFINDDLSSGVLIMGCFIGGLVCALLWGIYTEIKYPDLTPAIAVLTFLIGFQVVSLTMAVIDSGVCTYYVCYAEDPAALQGNDPEFYEKIRERHMQLTVVPTNQAG